MYKVVLVDDEELFLEGFKKMIDWPSYGFEITASFSNANNALHFLMENPADLVITDIKMPFMDGLEFSSQLRGMKPDLDIMILSGYSDFEYARKAIQHRVNNYLLKPVDVNELALTLMDLREKLDEMNDTEITIGTSAGYYNDLVDGIKKNIQRNYRTISLESIALDTKMSTNYVSKIFKKVSGQNFSDYLLEVKMTNALRLIGNGDLKIYEIAYMIGYDNPKNFTRAFKKYWGHSPWEYKENGFKK